MFSARSGVLFFSGRVFVVFVPWWFLGAAVLSPFTVPCSLMCLFGFIWGGSGKQQNITACAEVTGTRVVVVLRSLLRVVFKVRRRTRVHAHTHTHNHTCITPAHTDTEHTRDCVTLCRSVHRHRFLCYC